VNFMMVKMAEEASHGEAAVALWHETVCRCLLMVPCRCSFVVARDLIVTLYTPPTRQRADLHCGPDDLPSILR